MGRLSDSNLLQGFLYFPLMHLVLTIVGFWTSWTLGSVQSGLAMCKWLYYLVVALGTKLSFSDYHCEIKIDVQKLHKITFFLLDQLPAHFSQQRCHVQEKYWPFGWWGINRACLWGFIFWNKCWSHRQISILVPLFLWALYPSLHTNTSLWTAWWF